MAQLDEPDAKIEVYMAWRKNETCQTVLDFLESVRHVARADEQRPRNETSANPPQANRAAAANL